MPRQPTPLANRIAHIAGIVCFACALANGSTDGVLRAAEVGTISGSVHYDADPQRLWRYGRYYVSKSPEHTLSEVLVCLRGRGLKGLRPPGPPAIASVDQRDYRFIPETVAIREGDQVRFTNSDPALHNVRSVTADEALNVSLPQDGEFRYTFRRAGNSRKPIRIGCAFHSQMQAWIYVFDHPFFAVTGADGKFAFDGVPAGEYDLEVIHSAGGLSLTRTVTVDAENPLVLELRLSPDHLSK